MIIELYGLPGSGKTTFAKKLAAEKNYPIIKIRTKRELFRYNLLFLVKHPYKFFTLMFFVIDNSCGWKIFYFKLMNSFFHYNAKYQKALRYENAILDQAHFLNAFALFDEAVDETKMRKYFKLVSKPDKLIVLDIPFALSLERTKARGYFAREEFGAEYQKKWQRAIEINNQVFFRILTELEVDFEIR